LEKPENSNTVRRGKIGGGNAARKSGGSAWYHRITRSDPADTILPFAGG
jgi:hypothetical protein